MHIVIFTAQYTRRDPRKSRTFVQEQALALANSHQVTVIAPRLSNHRDALQDRCAPEKEETGTVYRPRCWYIRGIWWIFYLITCLRCASHIDWASVDIVHAHWSLPSGFTAALLARWHGKPFVLTEHAGEFQHLIKPFARRKAVFWTMNQASVVVVVSQALKKKIEQEGIKAKLALVPNIVDANAFSPLPAAESPTSNGTHLLWVGSFDRPHTKGLDLLLGGVALARERLPGGLLLTLVGDGKFRAESQTEAQRLEIDDICDFVGAVPHDQIPAWMQRCDALILASRVESFGVVLIEAMACGKPVIATRCGGPEDIVTSETGILVQAGDIESLAEGIVQLCQAYDGFDPAQIAEYARTTFDPARIAAMLTTIYTEVLDADSTD